MVGYGIRPFVPSLLSLPVLVCAASQSILVAPTEFVLQVAWGAGGAISLLGIGPGLELTVVSEFTGVSRLPRLAASCAVDRTDGTVRQLPTMEDRPHCREVAFAVAANAAQTWYSKGHVLRLV